jgi:hypothetical protein
MNSGSSENSMRARWGRLRRAQAARSWQFRVTLHGRIHTAALAFLALAACDRGGGGEAPPPVPKVATSPDAAARAPDPSDPWAALPPERSTIDASVRPGRALTDGELAILRPIFGASIDYTVVRILDDKFTPHQPQYTYMTPESSVYAPGVLWRDDFSVDPDPYYRAVFVHELAHVWQYQNGMDMVAAGFAAFASVQGEYQRAYPYTLTPTSDLLDFGMEQQASILEDWYLVRVHGYAPTKMQNQVAADERDALFAAVLARFIADPAYARGISAEEQLARQTAARKGEPPGPHGCGPDEEQQAEHLCDWRFERRQ